MKITDEQALVAKALVSGPKSIDELVKETGLEEAKVKEAIESLGKHGIVRKHKDKYRIIEAVRKGLEQKDRLDPTEYKFRVYAIFEGIAEDKTALEKAQAEIVEKFKADPRIEVLDLNIEEIIENEGVFTSMFEAEVMTRTFHDLVYMILTYGPTSIELIDPPRFEVKASEGQAILMDVAEAVHSYSQMVFDLSKKLREMGHRPGGVVLKVNK